MAYYGRFTTNGADQMGDINSSTQAGTVFQPMTEDGWGHTFGVWGGKFPSGSNATFKLAMWAVDGSLHPSHRLAYNNGVTASTVMDWSRAGAAITAAVENVNATYSPGTTAVKMYKNTRYAGGAVVTSANGRVALFGAAAIVADNENLYRKLTLTTPANPFGHTSLNYNAGHMAWWVEYQPNRAPTVTGSGPSGTITAGAPSIGGTFADADSVYGDKLSKVEIEVLRDSDNAVMWSFSTSSFDETEISTGAFLRTYAGSALAAGVTYKWRVRVFDDFNKESSWTSWVTFIVDDGASSPAAVDVPVEVYDGFSRVSASSWGTTDTQQAWSTLGTGVVLSTSGGRGQASVSSGTGTFYAFLNSLVSETEREILFDFEAPSVTDMTFGPIMNYQLVGVNPQGYALNITQNALVVVATTGGNTFTIKSQSITPLDANTRYWVRFKFDATTNFFRAKIWPRNTSEPTNWQLNTAANPSILPVSGGKPGFRFVRSSSTFIPQIRAFYVYSLNPDVYSSLPVEDTFSRTRDSGLGASDSRHIWTHNFGVFPSQINSNAATSDSAGSTSSGVATLAIVTPSVDQYKLSTIGPSHADSEVLTHFKLPSGGVAEFFLRGMTTTGSTSQFTGYCVRATEGSTTLSVDKMVSLGGSFSTIATDTLGASLTTTDTYWVRFQTFGTTLRVRLWKDGDTEPGTWNIDTSDSDISSGFAMVRLLGTTSTGRTYELYEYVVNPVGTTDSITPVGFSTTVLSDTSLRVRAEFTGDVDNDGAFTVSYRDITNGGSWQALSSGSISRTNGSPNRFDGVITGLSPNTQYELFGTLTDPDGVLGQENYSTTATTSTNGVRATSLLLVPQARSISIQATGEWDTNNTSTATYQYRKAEVGSEWSTLVAMTKGDGPVFVATTPETLETSTDYIVSVTFEDEDGVYNSPIARQVTTLGRSIHLDTVSVTPTETTALVAVSYQYDSNEDATVSFQYRMSRDTIYTSLTTSAVSYDRANRVVYATLSGLQPETTYSVRAIASDPDGIPLGSPTELAVSFNTLGAGSSIDNMVKHHLYRVYDADGKYLGTWRNAPDPSFSWDENGGVNNLDLRLPLNFNEANSDNTIEHGNRVDVWALDGSDRGMGVNLMVDPNGELGSWTLGDDWEIGTNTGASGSHSLYWESYLGEPSMAVSEPIALDRVVPVVLNCVAQARGAKVRVDVAAYDDDDNLLDVSDENGETVGTEWQTLLVKYLPPPNTSYVRVRVENDGAGKIRIGHFSMRVREQLIYRGVLDTYKIHVAPDGEWVDVEILGYASYLSDDYCEFLQYVNIQPSKDIEEGRIDERRDPADPSVMLRDLIDLMRVQNPKCPLFYTEESIKPTGVTSEYTFRDKLFRDCFDSVRTLCPPGWFFYIDPDGCVWLKGPEHVITHTLRLNVEILSYESTGTTRQLKNVVKFKGRQDSSASEPDGYGSINYIAQDSASIRKYGRKVAKITDSQITTPETAEIVCEGRLEEYNIVERSGKVVVPDEKDMYTHTMSLRGYNVQSLRPGDRVHILIPDAEEGKTLWDNFDWNDASWSTERQRILFESVPIKQLDYDGRSTEITLSHLPPTTRGEFAKMLAIARRNSLD